MRKVKQLSKRDKASHSACGVVPRVPGIDILSALRMPLTGDRVRKAHPSPEGPTTWVFNRRLEPRPFRQGMPEC